MKISSLFIYPVKGCRGIAVDSIELGESSMRDDRRFMIMAPDGAFLSQRQRPRMSLIETKVDGDVLSLRAPGQDPIQIDTETVGETRDVSVWETPCRVVDQGEDVAAWLSAFLKIPARLVAMADGYRRPVHEKLPREFDGRLTFADAAPLLVTSETSLEDLNRRLAEPVPMDRFRPNIVVAGCPPYAEDTWTRIRMGTIELLRLTPCGRCAVTTTDQATGERGQEPLATLATYRRDPEFGVTFGSYFGQVRTGRLALGDSVSLD